MSTKQDIRSFDKEEIKAIAKELGEPAFRGKQLFEWLWQKHKLSFDEMTNLPLAFRKKLNEAFEIKKVEIAASQISKDGTIKYAFRLHDGHLVEGVLIPSGKRMTACISSQIGCSLACSFCATGKMNLVRNLKHYEIYDQVRIIADKAIEHYDRHLSNIVYMGMGEPLLNYKEVTASVDMISSTDGMGMSPKRITISTAGIAKLIRKAADDMAPYNLALSLHAADDKKRNSIMAINETNTLESLRNALAYFHEKTSKRIFIEYILFHNFNDSTEDASALANFCKAFPVKVNLIEYNTVQGTGMQRASADSAEKFKQYLENCNMIVNIRRSKGMDIDAACGQLANKPAETIG